MAGRKDAHGPSKARRLMDAAENVDGRKSSRVIKFPNSSGALRQHVAQALKTLPPRPAIRLRIPASPAATADRSEESAAAYRDSRQRDAIASPEVKVPSASPSAGLRPIAAPPALGRIVRDAREHKGLTQAQLADLAGTGRRFISELEGGKQTLEFGRVLVVCKALGVQVLAAGPVDER